MTLSARFKNEDLASHWKVDESEESFRRLLYHLEVKTNVKPFFEEALTHLDLDGDGFANSIVIADIGAGVCWTSAILANHPKVKVVYAIEPSENRLRYAGFVTKHFGVEDKVRIINGTFSDPNVPDKVDMVLMCGSLHHCYDSQLPSLFSNIKRLLKPDGKILIADEHYVDWLWTSRRLLSYLKHFREHSQLFYYPLTRLRAPDPFGGEHWRTKRELKTIFNKYGFISQFFRHDGLLSKDKTPFYQRLGWHYYHAILKSSKEKF
jgi:SAM-dependent methyltransferase